MELSLSNNQSIKLKELTAGDIFDAQDAAKKLHSEGGNAFFIIDNIAFERLLLLKAISCVNDEPALATMNWLRGLSPEDYYKIVEASLQIDEATLSEVSQRGRSDTA